MELNEVQQMFFEKLKLLLIGSNASVNIAKAKEIFNSTVESASAEEEKSFIKNSLSPILQEFIRHLTEDVPSSQPENDAAKIIQENGEVSVNSNLTGFVNVRDDSGKISRQQLDVSEDLDIIDRSMRDTMKNFNKEFHEEEMDPELAEYIKLHGRK